MTALGYQILKVRGIIFTDQKKVKIKGSEVGFSLAKIEKIFALKQEQEKRSAALRRTGNKIGLLLSPSEREELKRISNRWTAMHYEVMRARIVLLADKGYSSEKIGRRLRISRPATPTPRVPRLAGH